MEKAKIRKALSTCLKIGIAIFVVFFLFRNDWLTKETFIKLFKVDNLLLIGVSSFFFVGAQLLYASRFFLLLRAIHFPLHFLNTFKLIMIGNFFNMVIPGMIGGDLIKGFYLFKRERESKGQSAGIIIMDRIFGLLALLSIAAASLIYVLSRKDALLSAYRYESYIILGIVGIILVFFGMLFVLGRNPWVQARMNTILKNIFFRDLFYRLLSSFGAIIQNRRILICSFLISLLIQLFSLTSLLILGQIVFEIHPDVITLAAVSSIVILIGIIPMTPGNIGWTELIAALGWSAMGSKAGAETFLYWRILSVFWSIPGGLFYLTFDRKWISIQKDEEFS